MMRAVPRAMWRLRCDYRMPLESPVSLPPRGNVLYRPRSFRQRHLPRKSFLHDGPRFADDRLDHLCGGRQVVDEADALPGHQRECIPLIFRDGLPVNVAGDQIMPRKRQDWRAGSTVALAKAVA